MYIAIVVTLWIMSCLMVGIIAFLGIVALEIRKLREYVIKEERNEH